MERSRWRRTPIWGYRGRARLGWGGLADAPGGGQSLLDGGIVGQGVVDVDLGDHLHRFAVEQRCAIDPLPDGFHGGGDEQRMAAYHGQVNHVALLADDGGQVHRSEEHTSELQSPMYLV